MNDLDFTKDFTEQETDELVKECLEHIHFVRNSSVHLYTTQKISELLQHLACWKRQSTVRGGI